MGCDRGAGRRETPPREGTITRTIDKVMNVMSLLLVGVGIAITATFFVISPPPDAEAASAENAEAASAEKTVSESAKAEGGQPEVPVVVGKVGGEKGGERAAERVGPRRRLRPRRGGREERGDREGGECAGTGHRGGDGGRSTGGVAVGDGSRRNIAGGRPARRPRHTPRPPVSVTT